MARILRIAAALLISVLLLPLLVHGEEAPEIRGYDAVRGYTYVTFGTFVFDTDGAKKPIIWRVLENKDGRVFLLSEYLLAVSRLHHDAWSYPGWEQADLRKWLLEDFVQLAFSKEEAQMLLEYSDLGKVSLPSAEDIKNKAYGFISNQSRMAHGTPFCDANGLYYYRHTYHSPYWTRTPSAKSFAQRTTKNDGSIGYLGVTADDLGVRPVIWLEEGSISISGGTGSFEQPFQLTNKSN